MNLRSFVPGLTALFYLAAFVTANADTPLETAMKQMSSAYKELSFDLQQSHDENKAHYLAPLGTLRTEAQALLGLVPKKVATLPADQQGAMVKAYEKSMGDLIQWIDSLTQDIQNSEWENARKVMGAIKQQMIHGHKDFRIKN